MKRCPCFILAGGMISDILSKQKMTETEQGGWPMFTDEYQKMLHAGSMNSRRILSALLCLAMLFLPACGYRTQSNAQPSKYEYIFVHGLSG